MEKHRRTERIKAIIDRIDRRGAKLMYLATEDYNGVRYLDYLMSVHVLQDRCRRVAALVDRMAAPAKRMTA